MAYKTILKNGIYKFEEKKSIFIGCSMRVENENEARCFVNEIKSKHSNAKHNVYGYTIGENLMFQRYADDGEPQGTAGIPIINVIKNNGLTDIAIVVTRYFGGVLLGTGGLTRAYIKAADGSIKNSKIVDKVLGNQVRLTVNYDLAGKIQYFLSENKIHIVNMIYEEKVAFEVRCEKNDLYRVKSNVIELTSNNLDIEIEKDVMYFRDNGKYYLRDEV